MLLFIGYGTYCCVIIEEWQLIKIYIESGNSKKIEVERDTLPLQSKLARKVQCGGLQDSTCRVSSFDERMGGLLPLFQGSYSPTRRRFGRQSERHLIRLKFLF